MGETINVCTSRTYSLREVVDLCRNITGHNIKIEVNPEFVRENEVRVLKGDNSLLVKTISDWEKYTLEDTLRWMLV